MSLVMMKRSWSPTSLSSRLIKDERRRANSLFVTWFAYRSIGRCFRNCSRAKRRRSSSSMSRKCRKCPPESLSPSTTFRRPCSRWSSFRWRKSRNVRNASRRAAMRSTATGLSPCVSASTSTHWRVRSDRISRAACFCGTPSAASFARKPSKVGSRGACSSVETFLYTSHQSLRESCSACTRRRRSSRGTPSQCWSWRNRVRNT
mmetsp:Transcript_4177/g.11685  ORF Transcript_4177/g.11685 Transcript_4177/m.11685 type:complete len:204 (-) Transcript_4177:988-1599(-)